MRTFAAVLNLVTFAATSFVIVTDGMATAWAYALLTIALLLLPVATVVALLLQTAMERAGTFRRATAIANAALPAAVAWAVVNQYPHPSDLGYFLFVALLVLSPAISAVVLFRDLSKPREVAA